MTQRKHSFCGTGSAHEATEHEPGTLFARPAARHQCWACHRKIPLTKRLRERPVQCMLKARAGKLTCHSHRHLEDGASEYRSGLEAAG